MSEEKKLVEDLYITINTDEDDFMLFQQLVPTRLAKIEAAPSNQVYEDVPYVNRLSEMLHPRALHLLVEDIKLITPSIKLIRLVPTGDTKALAYFRPGQYLSLDLNVGESKITRPYSIASSPDDSLKNYYEIAIKNNDNGFAAKYLFNELKVGDTLLSSGPCGHFYYDELRDKKHVVGIAGGSGITPFRSMARGIIQNTIDCEMTLFYGANTENELAFKDEFLELQEKSNGRFKVIFVLANEDKAGYEKGFISRNLLEKYVKLEDSSTFICGPQTMYKFIKSELAPLNLRRKLVRFELFGQPANILEDDEFPQDKKDLVFKVTVHQGDVTKVIDAKATETLVCSMERAGIRPPTNCRSGSCGFCRSQLIKGEVYISKKDDGRRYGDKEFGFIHPCCSYPLSDLEIVVPPTKE